MDGIASLCRGLYIHHTGKDTTMASKMGDPRLRDDYAMRVARGEKPPGWIAKILATVTLGLLRTRSSNKSHQSGKQTKSKDDGMGEMSVNDLQEAIARQYDRITPK